MRHGRCGDGIIRYVVTHRFHEWLRTQADPSLPVTKCLESSYGLLGANRMRRPQEYDMNSGNPLAPYSPPVYNVPTGPYNAPSHGTAIPPPARTVPTLMGLLNALKRRWVLASFLGLLVALAAAAALWISSPTGTACPCLGEFGSSGSLKHG